MNRLLIQAFFVAAAFAAAIVISVSPGQAEEGNVETESPVIPRSEDQESTFTVSFENDIFAGSDNNYTNGVRISYLSPEDDIPEWLDDAADLVPLFNDKGRKRWSLSLGQSMYTPDVITVKTLQANDRPYAGWLYGSVGIMNDSGYQLDNLQLTLGVVGPASGAAQTQDFIHDAINSIDPQGWDNQLKNEPGVVLTYERRWRGIYEFAPFGFGMDISPTLGGSVGNIFTHAAVGAIARVGYDLPADYGPPMIRPNLPGSDFFVPSNDFSWYLFTGVEGRAVARNIFLDGNTFTDSHSVDKKHLVGGLQAGVAFIINDMRLAYTHVLRTREFEQQEETEVFGALTASFRF